MKTDTVTPKADRVTPRIPARQISSRSRRRIDRHAVIAGGAAVGTIGIVAMLDSPDRVFELSMGTAYVATALWVITLGIGPLNLLSGRPNPVSTHVRRDIGIWAAILGLAHVFFGLQVHMGSWLLYFLRHAERLRPRFDVFGVANYTGLFAGAVLLLLLAMSNDLSLRRLGRVTWKRLQQVSYLAFAAMIVHALVYQLVIEDRTKAFVALFAVLCLVAIGLQALGIRAARNPSRTRSEVSAARAQPLPTENGSGGDA